MSKYLPLLLAAAAVAKPAIREYAKHDPRVAAGLLAAKLVLDLLQDDEPAKA